MPEVEEETTRLRGDGSPLAWYLGHRHELIRRHEERLTLRPDHSAGWELRVDLELPTDESPGWRAPDGDVFFPFPLAYLRKSEARMGFSVTDERGAAVAVPIRRECDTFAVEGLTQAAIDLLKKLEPEVTLSSGQLRASFASIVEEKAYPASMALLKLRRQVGLAAGDPAEATPEEPEVDGTPERGEALPGDEEDPKRREMREQIGEAWRGSGVDEVLGMLVEHSLVWVLLRGRPGARRSIVLREEKVLQQRPFIRWAFGELKRPTGKLERRVRFRRRRLVEEAEQKFAEDESAGQPAEFERALAFRQRPYGRRRFTFSLSTLGERIGQPLGWMPFEFEFPTIYMLRCASYHFELICPPGRTPRDLRLAVGPALAEPARQEEIEQTPLPVGARKTLTRRFARLDIPPGDPGIGDELKRDAWFRITVGIGDGAFPVLWFLVGAITAAMLWLLADANPRFDDVQLQIAAAILLVVPVLVSALALASNEVPIGQLVGGARILALASGLSAVAAAAILAGARPFELDRESAWALCAMVATTATVPLATSWLLSIPLIWRGLKELDTRKRQRRVLRLGAGLAGLVTLALIFLCGDPISRGILGFLLLLVPIGMGLVANDRAAMKVNVSRNYISANFLAVGVICLTLACIEFRGAIGTVSGVQRVAQWAALAALLGALGVGRTIKKVSETMGPRADEVHVSPVGGRSMLAGESVRELGKLQEREDAERTLRQSTEHAATINPYIGNRG